MNTIYLAIMEDGSRYYNDNSLELPDNAVSYLTLELGPEHINVYILQLVEQALDFDVHCEINIQDVYFRVG